MPTAGEYKHEPFGIPCRCYVKRRVNRLNTVDKKSCLRNSFDSKLSLPTFNYKKVKFDSVLRVRLYEKHNSFNFEDSEQILLEQSEYTSPIGTNVADELKPSVEGDAPDNDSFVYSKLASLNQTVEPDPITDLNNNQVLIDNETVEMNGDAYSVRSLASSTTYDKTCPHSASSVSRSFDKVFYCETGSTSTFPQRSASNERSSICEHGDCSSTENRSTLPPLCPSNGICNSGTIPGCGTATYPFSTTGCSICDPFVSFDSNEMKASTLPTYGSHSPMSTFVNSNRTNTSAPCCRMPDDASVSTLRPAKKHEHSDEYIYATPDIRDCDYEYVPIRSTFRRRTESENIDSSLTVTAFENADYKSDSILYRAEGGDMMVESVTVAGANNTQLSTVMQQSAPDLQAIVNSPYDIKFLNECVRAYKRQSQRCDNKVLDLNVSEEPRIRITEKYQSFPSSRKTDSVGCCALMRELIRMTPIALFWTGCAFLVAVIYILVFSCTHNVE